MTNSIRDTDKLPSIKHKDVSVLTPPDVDALDKTPNLVNLVTSKEFNDILKGLGISKDSNNIAVLTSEDVIAAQPAAQPQKSQNNTSTMEKSSTIKRKMR